MTNHNDLLRCSSGCICFNGMKRDGAKRNVGYPTDAEEIEQLDRFYMHVLILVPWRIVSW